MNELSGGAPAGAAPQRIEAGPGAYNGGGGDDGGRDLKPWQRGPTGAAAPWAQGGDGRGDDHKRPWAAGGAGADGYGGYGAPPGSAAPWQRQQDAPPPPPSGGQDYGYGGYPGAYGNSSGGYGGMGAPPGLGSSAGGLGAPPGLASMYGGYGANGTNGAAPPPPPGSAPPPPVGLSLLI